MIDHIRRLALALPLVLAQCGTPLAYAHNGEHHGPKVAPKPLPSTDEARERIQRDSDCEQLAKAVNLLGFSIVGSYDDCRTGFAVIVRKTVRF